MRSCEGHGWTEGGGANGGGGSEGEGRNGGQRVQRAGLSKRRSWSAHEAILLAGPLVKLCEVRSWGWGNPN